MHRVPVLAHLRSLADIRRGEEGLVVRSAIALFLVIAGHTALETARDSLVLARFPPRDLALVYVAVAIGVLPVSLLASWGLARVGPTRALGLGLLGGAGVLALLFLVPLGLVSLLALYVATALVSTVLVPLLWNLVGAIFSVTQGRRLLGPVSAAGVLGGASGSLFAVAAVRVLPVRSLLLVTAATLVLASFVIPRAPPAPPTPARPEPRGPLRESLRGEPFLRRIALLVAISTAAFVLIDFAFKWTLARSVAPERIPSFVSRYYAALNVLALIVQAGVGRRLVRRASIATTILVTPTFFLVAAAGAVATMATGAARTMVLALKGIDGTLRNSVHRVATELLYLPLSPEARARAKPLIDGALVRAVQGIAGLALFRLAGTSDLRGSTLALALLVTAAAWLAIAWTLRAPYLALLRQSVVGETLSPWTGAPDPLDLESAEGLVEYLSHDDPRIVLAAMNALVRRGRLRLLPGLILLHDDESVVTRALGLFRESSRGDWYSLARRRLGDARESIRRSAARALTQHGRLDASDVAKEVSAGARGFVAFHAAVRRDDVDPADDPVIADILDRRDAAGDEGRLGMLSAIALSTREPRLDRLLDRLIAAPPLRTRAWRIELARAVTSQQAARALPTLVALLDHRDGRDAVRTAIASFGVDGVQALRSALRDPTLARAVRVHVPNTLPRLGTRAAAELALETLEHDPDGLVRYKALRALGRIVAERRVKVDRARVEHLALENLQEHFRLLGLRAALDPSPLQLRSQQGERDPVERLLLGMLTDKVRQSLERTFRLLKIAHPYEDLHGVHDAFLSEDKRVRANATELVHAILRRCRVPRLRALLRVLGEEPALDDALARSAALLEEPPPRTREEALARLARDRDPMMAGLAASTNDLSWEGAAWARRG